MVIENKLKINKLPLKDIEELLVKHKFDKHENSFGYLTSLPFTSVSLEAIENINKKVETIKRDIEVMKNKNEKDMYVEDLETLKKKLK